MSGDSLTLDVLKQVINLAAPPLYYGLSDVVERGHVLHYQAPDHLTSLVSDRPSSVTYTVCEYILLHPDDLPALKIKMSLHSKRRLAPLSEAP